MSHLKYMKELGDIARMDEPIKVGPVPRWKKKCFESSTKSSIFNVSQAMSNTSNTSIRRTPGKKSVKKSQTLKGTKKSPSRSTTPTSKTPGTGGDRFIPTRSTTNFELGYYKLQQQEDSESECESSPSRREMQRVIGESLHGAGDLNDVRVFSYQNSKALDQSYKTPAPHEVKTFSRHIPQASELVLDAPEIVDDYYLNLLDWQASNILAVALGPSVFLWNAETGEIDRLFELEGNDYVCSVSWIQDGPHLAVGTTLGNTELWDCVEMRRVRVMNGHPARVGSLSWNFNVLTSGCGVGRIVHHDVRQRDHLICEINAHRQQICGLKWSPDGRYLASGGNDNALRVWPSVTGQRYSRSEPIYSFDQHQAAVKALDWCPWQNNVLASGGGAADGTIKIWNINTGELLNSVETRSQVSSLLWSRTYRELISGHGFDQNELTIWRYPDMSRVAKLRGHTGRVLNLAMSPDGATVVSAGADQTLRFWKCFEVDLQKKKEHSRGNNVFMQLERSIR